MIAVPSGALRTRTPMTEIGRERSQGVYIAEDILPTAPEPLQESSGLIWDSKPRMRSVAGIARQTGAEFTRVPLALKSETYKTVFYGVECTVDDTQVADLTSEYQFDPEAEMAMTVYDILMTEREDATAAVVHNSALYPSANYDASGPALNNATPTELAAIDLLVDFAHPAIEAIRASGGVTPDRLQVSFATYLALCRHPDVRAFQREMHHSRPFQQMDDGSGMVSTDALALFLGLGTKERPGRVIVADAVRTTSVEGQSAPNIAEVWSADKALFFKAGSPGVRSVPSLGHTWAWEPFVSPGGEPMMAAMYREERTMSSVIRGALPIQPQVHNGGIYGYLYAGLTA